ncbi:MAG: alpha/beta fold hydrolase [Paracoccus sp. (in: a-proteobacteria)]|uniref:alpha/beta fold hydrolase n=1 Tax=Paracoccus sp. TaxID=267 RepID=UPI0026DFFD38|nr:alpha/beta fold hydrolase [Paracoccus sp. (in: a-proteobacteria)]MDO5611725.1 alpha/beta fold hydrolase [Paracoccus sp. (in: a-proteobacteria)]
MQITDHRLDMGDATIAARVWHPDAAAGLPVLMLHDSLGSVALWRDLPEVLAQQSGRMVAAYDRAGYGQSSPQQALPPLDFIAAEAARIVQLADALGLDRFIIAGHSVGGGMAVETAAQYPDRVAGLITISAQAFLEDLTAAGIRAAKAMFAAPENLARIARYHGDQARWVVDAWTETWLHPGFADWSLNAALPQVRCPALVIHGEADEYGTAEHPRRIAAATGAQLMLIPGAGHLPHRENTAQVMAGMVGFLRGLP